MQDQYVAEYGGYTRNEIAFLLSLEDYDAAITYATRIVSSLGKLTNEQSHLASSSEDGEVPLLVRWSEVHAAKGRIEANKEHLALMQLRLQGHSEDEVAELMGIGRRTVGRRMRATMREILEILGTEVESPLKLDHVDLCLACAENPRGRTTSRTRVWTGVRWKTNTRERRSSLCAGCLGTATEIGQ